MKSFGRLLRKLRGATSLEELSTCTKLDRGYLASIEARRSIPDEIVARHILRQGFGLDRKDTTRLILGIQLYDLGRRDADFRQLVIDLILKSVPTRVREELRRLLHHGARPGGGPGAGDAREPVGPPTAGLHGPKVLVIDEMGYLPLDAVGATIFFQLVSARYERGSILLTSNKSYGEWAASSEIRSSPPRSWTGCCTTPRR